MQANRTSLDAPSRAPTRGRCAGESGADAAPQPSRVHSLSDMRIRPQPVLALLVVLGLSGCSLFRAPKAEVDVVQVQAAFSAVEQLGAVVYMHNPADEGGDPACDYFEYARGAYTSTPGDEFCRVFDYDDRQPGGGLEGPVPVAFDDQARADLASMLAAFDGVAAPLSYMNVVLAANGSIGPDSGFTFDRCVYYWYQPNWSVLPDDFQGKEVSTGINTDWYKTDSCP